MNPPVPLLPFPPTEAERPTSPAPPVPPSAPTSRRPPSRASPLTRPKTTTLPVGQLEHHKPCYVPLPASDDPDFDTPHALWDARSASASCWGPRRHREGSTLCCPHAMVRLWIDGCLPVAVMVGEDAR